jgi:hypothetical protein
VDDLLETALIQKSSNKSSGSIRKKQPNTPKRNKVTSSAPVLGTASSSGDKRRLSSSSTGSSHRDKRRKSGENSDSVYRYKDITVIDQRQMRKKSDAGVKQNESPVASNSRSRRKMKRLQARAVHTITTSESPVVAVDTIATDTLAGDMSDAPIEVLMAHVERIKNKLLALSEEEKNQETASASPVEQEQRSVSRAADSPADAKADDEEEDDIGELRRIAILSMKAKALEDSATAISSPVPAVTPQPQQAAAADDNEKEEEDEDVDLLRQQLLMSMKQNQEKRTAAEILPVAAVTSVSIEQPVNSAPPAQKRERRSSSFTIGSTDRLIIEFGNSSESEDDSEPPGLSSLLAAARKNCSAHSAEIPADLPASIKKLTIDKQLEYVRLKREIAKREKNVDTAKPLLDASEKKYSLLTDSIDKKKIKLVSIKESVAKKKDQYLKADAHAKKMEELLAAARTMVQHTAGELRRLAHELSATQQALVAEAAEVRAVDQECLRLGKEVQGASYVQPSKRATRKHAAAAVRAAPNSNLIAERNRLMAHQSAILNLVQKRNSAKSAFVAAKHKVTHQHRRLPSLNSLRKNNITTRSSGRENKDPKMTAGTTKIAKKRKQKAVKEENFEQSVALLFDRHLKEKAKEESAGVTGIEYLTEQQPILVPYTDSVFTGMPSLRLSPLFHKVQSLPLMSNTYSNAVDPFQMICYFDLHGVCKDPKCEMQHKSSYLLKDREKLMDILSYQPSLAGVSDSDLSDKQRVYERLEKFVDLFSASQSSCKSSEELAQKLVKMVTDRRPSSPPASAIRSGRPNYSHQSSFDVKYFKFSFNGELHSDGTEVTPGNTDDSDDD